MTVRLRERPERLRHTGGQDDRGVSPVIGMILVLAISVVGIAAILYWGLPAIDEMKANVEYRSVTTQFTELDSTIKELVAGTTEKTAKRWQPAMNRGSVAVLNNTEGWLLSTETYQAGYDYDLVWANIADGDNSFTIAHKSVTNLGAPTAITNMKVEAWMVSGTTSLVQLNVSTANGVLSQHAGSDLAAAGSRTFWVYDKDAAATPIPTHDLVGATFKFRVSSGSTVIAEAWYVNTGRVEYNLEGSLSQRSLIENNGVLLAGTSGSYAMLNSPPIPPPSESGGVQRFFGRLISISGNASFAGDSRFDLLISLYQTASLASYDCALTTHADCVESAKIFVYGDLQDTWYSHFTASGSGYRFGSAPESYAGVEYVEQREPHMAYTLLGSNVLMVG